MNDVKIPQEELDFEKKMTELNKTAPRLTPEDIKNCIRSHAYMMTPSGKSMMCEIVLKNGFTVEGMSSAVSRENFDKVTGREVSYKNAFSKIWELEAYLLQNKLYLQTLEGTENHD